MALLDAPTPFVWGAGGSRMTPEEIAAQRKVANALLAGGMDYSPVASPWQGYARVAQAILGGLESGEAGAASKQNASDSAAMLSALLGGGSTPAATPIAASATMPATAPIATPMGQTSIPAPSTTGKIYSNDEPSPLDPPSGGDRDAAIRTVLAEAGNQGPTGMNAVASVIRNRAVNGGFGGDTPSGVVTAPNQFEPWNTQAGRSKMAAIDPNSPAYANAGQAIDSAYMGNDPTNGATMFYGPKAQAALGRPAPSWDNGTGVDIGGHRFFGGAPQPTQVAQADPAALPASSQPTQGYAVPGQASAAPGINPAILQAMTSRYVDPQTKALAGMLFKSQMDAQTKAVDPLRQAQITAAQLSAKKTQQDLDKSDWQWKPLGRDANGNWSYGFVNSKTNEVRDANNQPIQQAQQPIDDPTAGLTGEDYLKAIPQDRANLARKVANGELDPASLPSRGNYRVQVLQDAARFDPTFTPADYKTRLATRKDFTSGKSAANITSFNTAIGHLDSLDKSVDALGNRGSSWYNMATAPLSMQTDPHYQAAVKDFRTSKQAVADELARAFKGAGGTVHDISEWEKTINEADSPIALHAAVKRAVELLRSRIDAVGDQYNRGMGKTTDPVSLLSPKARATLERLEGNAAPDQGGQRKTSSGVSWSIQ